MARGARAGSRVPRNIDTLLCEKCDAGHHEDKIILCDRCDKGYHLFCLSPPLDAVPEGDWVCPACLQGTSDHIFFKSGCEMTFAEMREWNDSFASGWFPERDVEARAARSPTLRARARARDNSPSTMSMSISVNPLSRAAASRAVAAKRATGSPRASWRVAAALRANRRGSPRAGARARRAGGRVLGHRRGRRGTSRGLLRRRPGHRARRLRLSAARRGRRRQRRGRPLRRAPLERQQLPAPRRREREPAARRDGPDPGRRRALALRRHDVLCLLLARRGPHVLLHQLQPPRRAEAVVRVRGSSRERERFDA